MGRTDPLAQPVRAALERVYDLFGRMPMPRKIEGCPCCIDTVDRKSLLSIPLRELTPDQLSRYASKVFTTVASEGHFEYYLPRILEIALTKPNWYPEPFGICEKIVYAGWQRWPSERREAVVALIEAQLSAMRVQAEPNGRALWEWIEGMNRLGLDVRPFFGRLLEPSSAGALLAMYERISDGLLKNLPRYVNQPVEQDGILNTTSWFLSEPVKAAIEKAYVALGLMEEP